MLERVIRARRHVDALRSALVSSSPDDLENCLPALEEAVACLREVERELTLATHPGTTDPVSRESLEELREEAEALRESVAIARRVILQGAAFIDGWLASLGVGTAGYTATGAPPAAAPAAKVSVEG